MPTIKGTDGDTTGALITLATTSTQLTALVQGANHTLSGALAPADWDKLQTLSQNQLTALNAAVPAQLGGGVLEVAWISGTVNFKNTGSTTVIPAGLTGRLINPFVFVLVDTVTACSAAPTLQVGNTSAPTGLVASQTPAGFTTVVAKGKVTLTLPTQTVAALDLSDSAVVVNVTVGATATALTGRVVIIGIPVTPA